MSSTRAVHEDGQNKSSGSGVGVAVAVATVGIGIGAALYYFFKPTPEIPHSSNSRVDEHQRNFRNRSFSPEPCAICTEEIHTSRCGDSIMLPCGHKFHILCIKPWVETNGTCPNCRKTV